MLMIYLLLIALAVTAFVTLFEPTAALYFAGRLDAASSILKAHASARAAARAAYRNIYRHFRRNVNIENPKPLDAWLPDEMVVRGENA